MNNKEILDNAPDGASVSDITGQYFDDYNNHLNSLGFWSEKDTSPISPRSLADIAKIEELEAIIRGRDELINNAVSSRIAELEKERDSLLRLIGYVKSIVFSKVECSYASFKRPLEELLKEQKSGS